jgi:hypothetical protein
MPRWLLSKSSQAWFPPRVRPVPAALWEQVSPPPRPLPVPPPGDDQRLPPAVAARQSPEAAQQSAHPDSAAEPRAAERPSPARRKRPSTKRLPQWELQPGPQPPEPWTPKLKAPLAQPEEPPPRASCPRDAPLDSLHWQESQGSLHLPGSPDAPPPGQLPPPEQPDAPPPRAQPPPGGEPHRQRMAEPPPPQVVLAPQPQPVAAQEERCVQLLPPVCVP